MQMNMDSSMGMNMTVGGMGANGTNGMEMMGHMKMYFHFSKEVVILFEGWKINSTAGIVWSMIVLFFMGVAYEGLKIGREALKRHEFSKGKTVKACYSNGRTSEKEKGAELQFVQPRQRLLSPFHFLQTLLHMVQVFIGYLLMLAFMTYNAWICIAIILGAGTGYFLFGWHRTSIQELGDHCL